MPIQSYRSIPFVLLTLRLSAQVGPPPQPYPTGPSPILQQRTPVSYSGSVPAGRASAGTLNLTLREALQMGLKYNFGILVNQDAAAIAAIERRRALSALLPHLSAGITQNSAQTNLAVFGFKAVGFPAVVGPFGYENARVYAQQTVYDRSGRQTLKSMEESQRAARLSVDEARNLVVQAVSHAWLAVVTSSARVTAIAAEAETA
ncbi:MAG TPA: TolC family protein, partial [Bryobacteraceae bacterium]|nr:TolC family protein [Bryobacteraceae bacterium]